MLNNEHNFNYTYTNSLKKVTLNMYCEPSNALTSRTRWQQEIDTTFLVLHTTCIKLQKYWTKYCSKMACTPVLNSGGPEFRPWPTDRLSWLRFYIVFLSPSRHILRQRLKLQHDHFLPHPFQILTHSRSYYMKAYASY